MYQIGENNPIKIRAISCRADLPIKNLSPFSLTKGYKNALSAQAIASVFRTYNSIFIN